MKNIFRVIAFPFFLCLLPFMTVLCIIDWFGRSPNFFVEIGKAFDWWEEKIFGETL